MPTKQRDPQRERFWRETIAAWQHSGRTIRDFCRDRQLTETSFHFWRRELRARAATRRAAATTPRPSATPPAFVPVAIVPEPSVAAALEVRCPSGHVVSLSGVDADTLRALFAALAAEGRSC